MNVRRRSGLMSGVVGSAPANAVTKRVNSESSAKPVKNAHNSPKSVGVTRVKGAVSG